MLLLTGGWWCADQASAWVGLPFSGGVVGLLILAALLFTGVLPQAVIGRGAEWLLGNMLLFFIPVVVSAVQFTGMLRSDALKLFISIGLGFTSVLLATAFTVEWVSRLVRRQRLNTLRAQRAARPSHNTAATAAVAAPVAEVA